MDIGGWLVIAFLLTVIVVGGIYLYTLGGDNGYSDGWIEGYEEGYIKAVRELLGMDEE